MNLIIVGLGGIGSHLVQPLFQYLNYVDNPFDDIIVIDGDDYEAKNLSRQNVVDIDNKAIATSKHYRKMFEKLKINFIDKYVNEENIKVIVQDKDVVLLCVDNNKTRMIFEKRFEDVENLTMLSGGNELHDGNVIIMQKKDDKYLTPIMSETHPEIADGKDKSPEEMSCEELAESSPQISIVNATIADIIRRTLYAMLRKGINFSEVFVNCETGNTLNVKLGDIEKKLTIDVKIVFKDRLANDSEVTQEVERQIEESENEN